MVVSSSGTTLHTAGTCIVQHRTRWPCTCARRAVVAPHTSPASENPCSMHHRPFRGSGSHYVPGPSPCLQYMASESSQLLSGTTATPPASLHFSSQQTLPALAYPTQPHSLLQALARLPCAATSMCTGCLSQQLRGPASCLLKGSHNEPSLSPCSPTPKHEVMLKSPH